MTIPESLAQVVRALGGLWDTQRAVTALHDTGYDGDQRQQERRARKAMRDLAKTGLLVKIQDRPVQYRTNQK